MDLIFNYGRRLLSLLLLISLFSVTACSDDDDDSTDENTEEVAETVEACNERAIAADIASEAADSPIYVAASETLSLTEVTTTGTYFYVDTLGTLNLSETLRSEAEEVYIVSEGECTFLGTLEFSNYDGIVNIECPDTITLSGTINMGQGSIVITSGSDITSEDSTLTINNNNEITLSNGATDVILTEVDSVTLAGDATVISLDDASITFNELTSAENTTVATEFDTSTVTIVENDEISESDTCEE